MSPSNKELHAQETAPMPMTLHGVFGSPLPGGTVVPSSVRFQELGNVGDKRVIGVGVSKEGANTEQHLAYGESRAPLILENVEADTSI
mmetsp:Transcript_28697/g.61198  ORF Transcript_28697/g.61198 Transcript_28697/m.61198 type:complete len:88 (-) Transcript_28697:809-1072(-)